MCDNPFYVFFSKRFISAWIRFAGFKSGEELFFWIAFAGYVVGAMSSPFVVSALQHFEKRSIY